MGSTCTPIELSVSMILSMASFVESELGAGVSCPKRAAMVTSLVFLACWTPMGERAKMSALRYRGRRNYGVH